MEKIYKDNYLVKDDGTIISLHYRGGYKQKELKHTINQKGYHRVRMGKRLYSVARIVYEAFNGSIMDGYEIDHIDGNKDNNSLSNLAMKSHNDNIHNPITLAKHNQNAYRHKIEVFDKNGVYICSFNSIKDAESKLSIPDSTIGYLLNNPNCNSKHKYIFKSA